MDVGVDEARHEHAARQPGDRLAGVLGAQRGEGAPGADDAVADQQGADLGDRVGRVARERVARRVDDRPGVQGHVVTLLGRFCSKSAATATAMTAGSLPVIPGRPIGQVIRAIAAGP